MNGRCEPKTSLVFEIFLWISFTLKYGILEVFSHARDTVRSNSFGKVCLNCYFGGKKSEIRLIVNFTFAIIKTGY